MAVKVSVIIPTYKRPALLKRCVEALISQDFAENDFEVIIVTDGLDEETNNMLSESALMDFFLVGPSEITAAFSVISSR